MLCVEHHFETSMCTDRFLGWLLSHQIRNECSTQLGGKYVVVGSRMSGDVNTSLGNGILNYLFLRCVSSDAGVVVRCAVDGDDSVTVVERVDHEKFVEALSRASDYGFEVVSVIREPGPLVQFCSGHVIRTDQGPRYIRVPRRVLFRTTWCVQKLTRTVAYRRLRATGYCEALCNDNVPVLGAFAAMLCRVAGEGPVDCDNRLKYRISVERAVQRHNKVSHDSRVDFAEITGLSIDLQIALECYFNTYVGTLDSELSHPALDFLWQGG